MDTHKFATIFPFGSHLCREPMPSIVEMKRDMENLKKHGFNHIKLQENWTVDEPTEGGYDFSRYEELIEYAAGLDLGVYLGLTCEQAPHWLYEKYPDCRMVGRDGYSVNYIASTTLPADGKPGPCFDHPGALADEKRFITELVRVLGRYENIVVWNTWQEIGYWAERLVGQSVCYCQHTIAFFREWLKGRYGDLGELNQRWNTRFTDWQSVFPDTLTSEKNATTHAIEFSFFMANVQIAKVLKDRAETIRNADPMNRPVFAHKGGPEIASGVDWSYARCQDFLGVSAYPAWNTHAEWDDERPVFGQPYDRHAALLNEMWENQAMHFDHIRSCNRDGAPVWAAEFQGGPVSTGLHKGRVPSRGDIRRWLLTTMASGATAVSFWVTRAEIMAPETNGFSLLDSTGDTTERYEEAAGIGAALNRYPDLFGKPTLESPRVGIIVNESNYQICGTIPEAREHLVFSTRGWYRMLWELGVSTGFVDAGNIGKGAENGYSLLIQSFPLSVSEELINRLEEYVQGGGYLVSEACIGRLNEYTYANRGEISPAAARLFGVDHQDIRMVREPVGGKRWMPRERTWGEFIECGAMEGCGVLAGTEATPALYVQTFTPTDSDVVLRFNGQPAGVVNQEGRAMLIGSLLGHQGNAYRDPGAHELVSRIIQWARVADFQASRFLIRKRKNEKREAWFFTNPTPDPVTELVDVSDFNHVTDLLDKELVRRNKMLELTVESLDVRVIILDR